MRRCVYGLLAIILATNAHCTTPPGAAVSKTTLVLEIEGDLLRHGGVVVLYPIPVPAGEESKIPGEPKPLHLAARYDEVQMLYPAGGEYIFSFHAAEDGSGTATFRTQLLTIIGTDEQGRGIQMREGFEGRYTSGGQVIRVLPHAEWAAPDEATRSNARWGRTEAYADPPPADERDARALASVMDDSFHRVPLVCEGDARAKACTVPQDRWAAVEALWWRSIAEERLERLNFYALNRCYEKQWFRSRTCEDDPDSDEPEFR